MHETKDTRETTFGGFATQTIAVYVTCLSRVEKLKTMVQRGL